MTDSDIRDIMERCEKANKAYEVPERPRTTGEDMLRLEDIRIFDKHSRHDIPALCRDLLAARQENLALKAEQAAIWGALEELGKWPKVAKIDFFTVRNGDKYAVEPSLVAPVFEAIRKHSQEMLSFGKSCVEALHNQERMRADLLAANKEIERLQKLLTAYTNGA